MEWTPERDLKITDTWSIYNPDCVHAGLLGHVGWLFVGDETSETFVPKALGASMELFSDLEYVNQATALVLLIAWTIHISTSPSRSKTSTFALVLLSLSMVLFLVYDVLTIWIRYTEGIVQIPNIPTYWYVTRPRTSWTISPRFLFGVDLLGNYAWIFKTLGIFLGINQWHSATLQALKKSGSHGMVFVLGLAISIVGAILLPLLSIYFAPIKESILVPHTVYFVNVWFLTIIVGYIAVRLKKIRSRFRKTFAKMDEHETAKFGKAYVALESRITGHFGTSLILLESLMIEALGWMLIDIFFGASPKSGLFVLDNKLLRDTLTGLHLAGFVGSYLCVLSLACPFKIPV